MIHRSLDEDSVRGRIWQPGLEVAIGVKLMVDSPVHANRTSENPRESRKTASINICHVTHLQRVAIKLLRLRRDTVHEK